MSQMISKLINFDPLDRGSLDVYRNILLKVFTLGRYEIPDDFTRLEFYRNLVDAGLLERSGDSFVKLTKIGKRAVSYLQEEEDVGMY